MKIKTMDALISFVVGRGNMNISNRINRVILFICMLLMVFFGFAAFAGIYNSKDYAIDISNSIGNEAFEKSSDILRDQKYKDLLYKIEERTKYIESEVHDFCTDVKLLDNELKNIYQHPENFKPRPVRLGRDFIEGDVAALRFAPFVNINDLNVEPLSTEIDMLGNLQDLFYFLSLKYRNPDFFDAPTFGILTESGIGIMADSAVTIEQWHNGNDNMDFWSTILYQETKKAWFDGKKNEPIYTSTYSKGINNYMGQFSCSMPYEINGEFAGIIFFSILMDELAYLVEPTTVNNDSINFVLNDKGNVLLSSNNTDLIELDDLKVVYENPPDIRQSQQSEIANIAQKMTAGEKSIEEIFINDNHYYVAYMPIKDLNWSLGVVMPANEITENVEKNQAIIEKLTSDKVATLDHRFLLVMFLMILFAVIIWAVVNIIGRKLANKFVKPIQELSDGVREISSGNFDKKLSIHTGDEIEHLATCFNAMTDELQTYMKNLTKMTADKERIATELDIAKNIQTSMLPNVFPAFPDHKEFDIYATMNAAKEVGGDFYDFYLLDENHLLITIADVSGKGIPAALFMANSKTILKNFAMTMSSPDDLSAVMTLANNQLCQNNDAMMFVTVFIGMLNVKTGEFIFVNGGHNPPLIYHKSENKYEYLKVAKNFVLGGMEDIDFKQQSIQLNKGDSIFLYTDGVTEALNPNNDLYSEKRLLDCLNRSEKDLSVEDLLAFVRADVNNHVDGADQSDDITMLILKFN